MDDPKPPTNMTDQELLGEWHGIDCDTGNQARTEELAIELERRHLDV